MYVVLTTGWSTEKRYRVYGVIILLPYVTSHAVCSRMLRNKLQDLAYILRD